MTESEAINHQVACPVCGAILIEGYVSWHYYCTSCKYERGFLTPEINAPEVHRKLDELKRIVGLKKTRIANAILLVEILRKFVHGEFPRLLDVGSGYGWFLDIAASHFNVTGLEPDEHVAGIAEMQGKSVIRGYFPSALQGHETFDVIVFNDVLEHIPNIPEALSACKERLNSEGFVLLCMPDSSGFLYNLSKRLHILKIRYPFYRLWQFGLPSPHVHYFNINNISELMRRHGFIICAKGHLPTALIEGVYDRIAFAGINNSLFRLLLWAMIVMSVPLLKFFPSDIFYAIFKRQ